MIDLVVNHPYSLRHLLQILFLRYHSHQLLNHKVNYLTFHPQLFCLIQAYSYLLELFKELFYLQIGSNPLLFFYKKWFFRKTTQPAQKVLNKNSSMEEKNMTLKLVGYSSSSSTSSTSSLSLKPSPSSRFKAYSLLEKDSRLLSSPSLSIIINFQNLN